MKTYKIEAPTPQGPATEKQQAFLLGVEFHDAAIRAGLPKVEENGTESAAVIPMVVCYAFSVELYFKSLISHRTGGHELAVLFEKINSPIRKEIAAEYELITGRNQRQLEADTQHLSKIFVDWRYVYEGAGQQIYTNLLVSLAKTALKVAGVRHAERCRLPHVSAKIARLLSTENAELTVCNLGGGTFIHAVDGTGTVNRPEV